jgi:hypothetical protein
MKLQMAAFQKFSLAGQLAQVGHEQPLVVTFRFRFDD